MFLQGETRPILFFKLIWPKHNIFGKLTEFKKIIQAKYNTV